MPKNKYLTNRELLTELEKRLPEFTQDELMTLMGIIHPYQSEILKIIQKTNPQVYD
jgi:hypothetical protein